MTTSMEIEPSLFCRGCDCDLAFVDRLDLHGRLVGLDLGDDVAMLAAIAVVAPLAEELLFRGLLHRGLRDLLLTRLPAGWSIAVLGPPRVGPLVGMGVLASSAAMLPRRLEGVPAVDAWRLAVHGQLGAGRQLTRAVLRAWWPVGVVAAVPGSPLRRPARRALAIVAAVAVWDAAIEARWSGSNAGAGVVAAIAALAVADDMREVLQRDRHDAAARLAWPISAEPMDHRSGRDSVVSPQ